MDSYKENRFLAEFYALAPHIYPLPSFPGWNDALLLQGEHMGKALKGEMTPRRPARVQPRMRPSSTGPWAGRSPPAITHRATRASPPAGVSSRGAHQPPEPTSRRARRPSRSGST